MASLLTTYWAKQGNCLENKFSLEQSDLFADLFKYSDILEIIISAYSVEINWDHIR